MMSNELDFLVDIKTPNLPVHPTNSTTSNSKMLYYVGGVGSSRGGVLKVFMQSLLMSEVFV